MTRIQLLLVVLLSVGVMAFKFPQPSRNLNTGTYGVCSTNDNRQAKVQLTINEDHTYRYFDNSNPKKVVDVKGDWELNGNTISLNNHNSAFPIHDKWKIDNNENCLKSRKGATFYRLCLVK